MALYVQKFGGTSVGSLDRIEAVADGIARSVREGHQLVVVLSAMAGETNRLLELASQVSAKPSERELDMLVSTGEQISIALMAMALQKRGIAALSLLASQVGIDTDGHHGKAEITHVCKQRLSECLALGQVAIVAGFQGVSPQRELTTLGRGGSDTTAVALAAAIGADECQIFTDVEGVYTTDPRVEPKARKMDHITFEEMLEMSSMGARVLQIRSVEFAGRHRVPLRVLSSFKEGEGTLINYDSHCQSAACVTGIAFSREEASITLTGLKDQPGIAAAVFSPLAEAKVEVDMIVQSSAANECVDLTFTVHRDDFTLAKSLIKPLMPELGVDHLIETKDICKVSVVGASMQYHTGIAKQMFEVLGREGIKIHLIATSEIKISVAIDEKYLELAVRSLHSSFGLGED
ncbi:aspartate kinase [Ferrimonas sediminum]|uniref:Aspartokinase n=1 Tax=Ferrimonas sediminum TaxID=718193 RepID=A0A1G8PK97_9GAMM|nr:aspartate kinase [Ferrimonas sediminum]SDI92971.1 aspartate kinase [Ferrimonas sediminum]